jgi:hypothetical protein
MERSILLAKVRTKKMVKKENKILSNGNVKEPIKGIDRWKNSVNTAPTDAPEDTPNVYGSANGFLSRPWKAAPAIAREAPTRPDKITLGKRMFRTILEYIGSIVSNEITPKTFALKILIMVKIGTETVPIEIPNKKARTRNIPAII